MSALVIPPSKGLAVVTLEDRAQRAREAFNAMESAANQMGAWAIVLGMEFLEVKKTLGETRGRPSKNNSSSSRTNLPDDQSSSAGTFDQWLETHFPEISRTRAYDYIRVARESKAGMLKSGSEAITSLLSVAPSQMNDEQRALLHEQVKGFAGERDVNQLLLDFGLVKKGRKVGKGTGDNGSETKALKKDDVPPGWDPSEWADYVEADEETRAAIDLWREIEIRIREELNAHSLAHLPTRFRTNVLHAAQDLTKTLEAATPRKGARS
jgi:hypothetical protein